MGTRRQFGREFKIEAVKLVTERGVPTFKFITGKRSLKFRFPKAAIFHQVQATQSGRSSVRLQRLHCLTLFHQEIDQCANLGGHLLA